MTDINPFAKLRVMVVGLGSVGIRHLNNLRKLGCGKVGVFRALNRPLHDSVDLENVLIHKDFTEALSHGYDAVVICNPTSLHLEVAIPAAEAGCHLYIEKPVSNTLDKTDELYKTIQKNNLKVMIGYQFRFHPNLNHIKNWLDQKCIGRIISVHVDTGEYLPGWHPWEDYRKSYAARNALGGGVILTTIHDIDYLYWLFGPLHTLGAIGGVSGYLDLDVEDYMSAFLLSKDSIPVFLHIDYLQRPPCRRMKIIGNCGFIEWDYYSGKAYLSVDGELRETSELEAGWNRNDLFMSIMHDFLGSICNGYVPRVSFKDGMETLKIALEIKSRLDLL